MNHSSYPPRRISSSRNANRKRSMYGGAEHRKIWDSIVEQIGHYEGFVRKLTHDEARIKTFHEGLVEIIENGMKTLVHKQEHTDFINRLRPQSTTEKMDFTGILEELPEVLHENLAGFLGSGFVVHFHEFIIPKIEVLIKNYLGERCDVTRYNGHGSDETEKNTNRLAILKVINDYFAKHNEYGSPNKYQPDSNTKISYETFIFHLVDFLYESCASAEHDRLIDKKECRRLIAAILTNFCDDIIVEEARMASKPVEGPTCMIL